MKSTYHEIFLPFEIEEGKEIDLLFQVEIEAPCEGSRGDYGVKMEPDDPGSARVISITNEDGEDMTAIVSDMGELSRMVEEAKNKAWEEFC